MQFIQTDYFKGMRIFNSSDNKYTLEVDYNGDIKRVYENAGFDKKHGFIVYNEINKADYPLEIKNAKFEKI